jgi:hypothetical protein
MRQGWRCIVCKAQSCVTHKRDAGVTEVVERILASHRRRSPDCIPYLNKIRTTNWRKAAR